MYFVESGVVELLMYREGGKDGGREGGKEEMMKLDAESEREHVINEDVTRVHKVSSGGIFGETDFLLSQPRSFRSVYEAHLRTFSKFFTRNRKFKTHNSNCMF